VSREIFRVFSVMVVLIMRKTTTTGCFLKVPSITIVINLLDAVIKMTY
jgi:hypothetical protein